ncbi:hypothetical protein KRP22_012782 [Phytophthora ramorum]|nr:hypothetical protein KRP22_8790 [Phytophthora ramorum]
MEIKYHGEPLHVELVVPQEYEEAAKFVHQQPAVGQAIAFAIQAVIFEEVQDLVLPGKSASGCFIQLQVRLIYGNAVREQSAAGVEAPTIAVA